MFGITNVTGQNNYYENRNVVDFYANSRLNNIQKAALASEVATQYNNSLSYDTQYGNQAGLSELVQTRTNRIMARFNGENNSLTSLRNSNTPMSSRGALYENDANFFNTQYLSSFFAQRGITFYINLMK